jgi:hypothetical protein
MDPHKMRETSLQFIYPAMSIRSLATNVRLSEQAARRRPAGPGGATFAMVENIAAPATPLQHLCFSSVAAARCEPIHRITLRPKGGMVLKLTPASTTG